jgi:2-oxoglutarate dehydrogenase E1 component
MGAWTFVQSQIRRRLGPDVAVTAVAREESGSPASGSQTVHDREQDDLLNAAISEPI